jgi:hypothetical protein
MFDDLEKQIEIAKDSGTFAGRVIRIVLAAAFSLFLIGGLVAGIWLLEY